MKQRIEIPLSKKKMARLLLLAIVFVAGGAWMLAYSGETSNFLLSNPVVKNSVAVAAILFFGWSAFFFVRKLSDKRPGFVIDAAGVQDNTSGVAFGQLPWTDISGFSRASVYNQEFLIIHVFDPERYLEQATGRVQRMSMSFNLKQYGSPFAVSANTLTCSLAELEKLLREHLAASHAQPASDF
ncbi:STM3941 family protein [Flaviaesturariibacter terrae]